jgi:hypothetical protein
MDDLIAWLSVQLDDDERVASIIRHGGYLPPIWHATVRPDGSADLYAEEKINYPPDAESEFDPEPFAHVEADRLQHEHIARWDPARVLAEVEAKRTLIARLEGLLMYATSPNYAHTGIEAWATDTLKQVALPMAGRDGWREEWRA